MSHSRYVVFPDGGGRHPTANVQGDFAADRGTTAAANPCLREAVDRTVIESKRQETCVLKQKKLRFAGLIMANPQHPQRIISHSRVLPTVRIVNVAGGTITPRRHVIWGMFS